MLRRTAVVQRAPNQRQAVARSNGLKYVDTPFVMFLDHDDLLKTNTLSKLIDFLEHNSEIVYAYGDADPGNDIDGYVSTQKYITNRLPEFWTIDTQKVDNFRISIIKHFACFY
jgi:glycosyltransferase involved in cell wall biosynthesis